MPGVYAVNMAQPELNDLRTMYGHTVDKRIHLIGLETGAARQALLDGRDLCGRAHGWDGG